MNLLIILGLAAAIYYPQFALFLIFCKLATGTVILMLKAQTSKGSSTGSAIDSNTFSTVINRGDNIILFINAFVFLPLFVTVCFFPIDMLTRSLGLWIYFDVNGSIISFAWNKIMQPFGGFYLLILYLVLLNIKSNFLGILKEPAFAALSLFAILTATGLFIYNGKPVSYGLPLLYLIYFMTVFFMRKYKPSSHNFLGEPLGQNFSNQFFCISDAKSGGFAKNPETLWMDSLRLFKRAFFVIGFTLIGSTVSVEKLTAPTRQHALIEIYKQSRSGTIECARAREVFQQWIEANTNQPRLGLPAHAKPQAVQSYLDQECATKKTLQIGYHYVKKGVK